jgi:hypothetical protein
VAIACESCIFLSIFAEYRGVLGAARWVLWQTALFICQYFAFALVFSRFVENPKGYICV